MVFNGTYSPYLVYQDFKSIERRQNRKALKDTAFFIQFLEKTLKTTILVHVLIKKVTI